MSHQRLFVPVTHNVGNWNERPLVLRTWFIVLSGGKSGWRQLLDLQNRSSVAETSKGWMVISLLVNPWRKLTTGAMLGYKWNMLLTWPRFLCQRSGHHFVRRSITRWNVYDSDIIDILKDSFSSLTELWDDIRSLVYDVHFPQLLCRRRLLHKTLHSIQNNSRC